MKKIAILTSGGDSQGMNTAVRAVAKSAITKGIDVYGIKRGYKGLYEDQIFQMTALNVSGIADQGGTILLSARLPEFKDPEVRAKAAENLKKRGIDGLVVIGGDGSFHGAHYLYTEHGIKTIGIPGTIDNDVAGTDYTIGYDTALNIILDAISKIKDTAISHERTYLIEVMGRNCGDLALYSAIAGGASGVLIPEVEFSIDDLAEVIKFRREEGKLYDIIIVAEGVGNVVEIQKELSKKVNTSIRVTILGHVQRGGSPTAFDRILATRMGVKAVELLDKNYRKDMEYLQNIKTEFAKKIEENIADVKINSIFDIQKSSPKVLNVSFKGTKGEVLTHFLGMNGIYVSTGSACSSKKGNSRILTVMGLKQDELDGAIRFSFSSENTLEEIEKTVEVLKKSVEQIRKMR